MKYALATLALAASSLATPVPAASSSTPSGFKITSVVSGGSGCPQGSIDVDWTDSKLLPIRASPQFPSTHPLPPSNAFSEFNKAFTAQVGSTADASDSRKNCQINLKLQFDPGFSFSVYQADFSGWGDLDAGVTGVVKSTYYFSGQQDQVIYFLFLSSCPPIGNM